jgi:putative peptidoglycan lipid II flippase
MVRRALSLMYSEIRGLHQAAYLLALFALGSQLLAIVRDRTLAHTFGAGSELDLYYAAFRIPDILFVLFVSVLSVYVLLPFVDRARAVSGNAAGARVLGQFFTLFLYVYVLAAGVLFVCVPLLIPWLFPGLTTDAATLTLLTRIMLLQPFLLGLSTLFGVITQAERRFVLYAVSPLLYNLGIIFGVLVLYPYFGLQGLVWGVVAGAAGHMLIQWPLVRKSELWFHFVPRIEWSLIREVLFVAVPRALTLSVHQIILLILVGVATTMTAGSVAVFQLAFNLQSVPLAIIGMSYSVAAFPMLAEFIAKNDRSAFNTHVISALRHIIFWSLPIVGLIIVLRAQLVRTLFGSGSFDWSDTRLTAAVLALFVISLLGQSILLLLVRAFYAASKMFVPLCVAGFGVVVTLGSAVWLHSAYTSSEVFRTTLESLLRLTGVPGTEVLTLSLAFTLGVLAETIILLVLFVRTFAVDLGVLWRQTLQALCAALVGALASYLTLNFIVDGVNQETFIGIFLQGIVAGTVGLVAIVLAYIAVGSRELGELYRSFKTKLFKADVIAPQVDTIDAL